VKANNLGELFITACKVQKVLIDAGIKFCFIGGISVQRWGKVRITKDVDLTLFAGFGNEKKFIDLLAHNFKPRRDDYNNFAESIEYYF